MERSGRDRGIKSPRAICNMTMEHSLLLSPVFMSLVRQATTASEAPAAESQRSSHSSAGSQLTRGQLELSWPSDYTLYVWRWLTPDLGMNTCSAVLHP